MCVMVVKYFKGTGWVGVKNRDRKYKPEITIKQSNKNDVQRLYIWDEKSKYTEGLNEFGISILHTSLVSISEGSTGNVKPKKYDGDAKKIRDALLEKDIEKSLKVIQESQIQGSTLVFNSEKCYMVEGVFLDRENEEDFIIETEQIKKDNYSIRTNHLVFLRGKEKNHEKDKKEMEGYNASEKRRENVSKVLKGISNFQDMLESVSYSSDKNIDFNPLRIRKEIGEKLHTTGQTMLVPSMRSLHYKPIWGSINVNFNKINSEKSKTFCEIISNKKFITFKEWYEVDKLKIYE